MDEIAQFEWGQTSIANNDETAVEAVIRAVTDVSGQAPDELEPLHTAVDAEALNTVFRHAESRSDSTLSMTFTYEGYEIYIDQESIEVAVPAPLAA